VLFATADGTVKRTTLDQYGRPRAGGIEAISLKSGDRVVDVQVTGGTEDVVLVGRNGRAIRFKQEEVPLMGRVAQGVRGIKLKEGEPLAGMVVIRREQELLLVTERGQAKRVSLEELPVQGRGGMGTAAVSTGRDTGPVVAARDLHSGEDMMAVTAVGRTLRILGDQVVRGDRALAPEPAVTLSAHDRVVDVTRLAEPREKPGAGDDDGGEGAPVAPDAALELGDADAEAAALLAEPSAVAVAEGEFEERGPVEGDAPAAAILEDAPEPITDVSVDVAVDAEPAPAPPPAPAPRTARTSPRPPRSPREQTPPPAAMDDVAFEGEALDFIPEPPRASGDGRHPEPPADEELDLFG
jgi:hypothetical protein